MSVWALGCSYSVAPNLPHAIQLHIRRLPPPPHPLPPPSAPPTCRLRGLEEEIK